MKFNTSKIALIASLTTITTLTHANQSSEIEQLRAEVNELRQMLQAQHVKSATNPNITPTAETTVVNLSSMKST